MHLSSYIHTHTSVYTPTRCTYKVYGPTLACDRFSRWRRLPSTTPRLLMGPKPAIL